MEKMILGLYDTKSLSKIIKKRKDGINKIFTRISI